MSYSYSQVDKANLEWFPKDTAAKSLLAINLPVGVLRGLHPCNLNFRYPLSVIAGKNGSGKSTILAMACCAYHNTDTGYIPYDRKKNYYTFSDFFIQTEDEVKVEGVKIVYSLLSNNWKRKDSTKSPQGKGFQIRYKKKGGKWNRYDRRVKRNVVFSGTQRLVPPGERKTDRNSISKFQSIKIPEETRQKILDIASRVLDKTYTTLDLRTVNKSRLFVVDRKRSHYSGFNMGAGENAVFSLLIEFFSAREKALLVIDEIELGLHEEAQRRLMKELKELCLEYHSQIICSTHSAIIIDSVPPEARFYVDSSESSTEILSGISSEYATGKLSGGRLKELTIFVEDDIAKEMIKTTLPVDLRIRVKIMPIGSDQAVLRQLCANYREGKNNIAILDGDKRKIKSQLIKQFKKYLETTRIDNCAEWIESHLFFLPGEEWPEKFLVSAVQSNILENIAHKWNIQKERAEEILDSALLAGKHNEFHSLQEALGSSREVMIADIVNSLKSETNILNTISDIVQTALSPQGMN